MAIALSPPLRVSLRIAAVLVLLLVASYVGRPLYWKLSATVQEIRENKQTVQQGLANFVLEAQRSVGWYHDESDSGYTDDESAVQSTRRIVVDDDDVVVLVDRSDYE
ncbi:hypothetical protein Sjap_007671 [Stephania japonica]|uniref:Uncharacterized protein n=1 Tax=Stephania japonica TaxID=461633 RepID=A0AAP0PAM7_9MAGN